MFCNVGYFNIISVVVMDLFNIPTNTNWKEEDNHLLEANSYKVLDKITNKIILAL